VFIVVMTAVGLLKQVGFETWVA